MCNRSRPGREGALGMAWRNKKGVTQQLPSRGSKKSEDSRDMHRESSEFLASVSNDTLKQCPKGDFNVISWLDPLPHFPFPGPVMYGFCELREAPWTCFARLPNVRRKGAQVNAAVALCDAMT